MVTVLVMYMNLQMSFSTIQLESSPGVQEPSVVKGDGFPRLQTMVQLRETNKQTNKQTTNKQAEQ